MVFVMAWRNIWRNRTRSLLVMLSVVIGLWAGIFTMAFVKGLYADYMKDTIQNYLSNIQIHQKDFSAEQNVTKTITLGKQQFNYLQNDNRIKGFAPRTITQVMMASPVNAVGVNAIGVKPFFENATTGLSTKVVSGFGLDPSKKNGLLIGEKTAKKLKVKLKNKVVLSFQDANGDITSATFRISGIFRSSNSSFDEANVYVLAQQMQKLTNIPDTSFHELAILLKDEKQQDEMITLLKDKFKNDKVQTWMQLSPELDLLINSFDLYMYIFIGIILLALSFGIINTMLMAVLERVREIGMLMAIGMTKTRIFFMIITETVLLSIAGSPIGFIISYISIYFSGKYGINLTKFSEGFSSYGYSSIIYPVLDIDLYFSIYIMTFIAALLSSLYPAIRALKLKPVEAIRKI